MLSPAETNTHAVEAGDHSARASQLAALRAELALIATEFGQVVEARSAQARDFAVDEATAGLSATRSTIRSQPLASLAVAAIAGAALAVLVIPKGYSRNSARGHDWSLDATRAELNSALDRVRNAMPHANTSSLMSSFERMIESLSSIDAKSTLMPAWEKLGPWLQSLRGSTIGK